MTQVKALCPFQIFLEKREAPEVRLRALLPFNPSTSYPSPLPQTGRGLRGFRGGNVKGWFIFTLFNSQNHSRVVVAAAEKLKLKGSFTIFLFLVRTHILDSNEVWYS